MEVVLILTIVGLFVAAAAAFGADTSDGDDWNTHRSL